MPSKFNVQIRVTGRKGQVDGYVEMILGTLMLSGVLVNHQLGKKDRAGGVSQIYMDLNLLPAPLGNIGDGDIVDYKGDLT